MWSFVGFLFYSCNSWLKSLDFGLLLELNKMFYRYFLASATEDKQVRLPAQQPTGAAAAHIGYMIKDQSSK